jgi:hypothetical protein
MLVTDLVIREVMITPNGDKHACYQQAVVKPNEAKVLVKVDYGKPSGHHVVLFVQRSEQAFAYADLWKTIGNFLKEEETASLTRSTQAMRQVDLILNAKE